MIRGSLAVAYKALAESCHFPPRLDRPLTNVSSAMRQTRHVPSIDRDKLADDLRQRLPGASITAETINPEFASWRINVVAADAWAEVFWGPLSGFGVTDHNNLGDDPDPFAPYIHPVESAEAAISFVVRVVRGRDA